MRLIHSLRRTLARLCAPLLLPFIPVEDPWERLEVTLPVETFGIGSTRQFGWYFEGESRVDAPTIDAVCDWLTGCTYVSDVEQFAAPDVWQHPLDFEQVRLGDCEDFALWAWRKLVEAGYDAELVSGRWNRGEAAFIDHAWVMVRHDGAEWLLETVSRSRARMVQQVDAVREQYRPHAGVTAQLRTIGFAGALLTMQEERAAARPRAPESAQESADT